MTCVIAKRSKDTVSPELTDVSCQMLGIDIHDPCRGLEAAADLIRHRWQVLPEIAVVAGSGLGILRSMGRLLDAVPYSDLPGLSLSTVDGHGSDLCLIECENRRVALFTGRLHLYEGHAPHVVAQQLALMKLLGCTNVLLTNACGGLNPARSVGDIVVVRDVLNHTARSLEQPKNTECRQHRHVVDDQWCEAILRKTTNQGMRLEQGIFAQMLGPSYETRAEIRMLRRIGADIVGMSSAVEAAWASSVTMRTAILSVVTNTLTDTMVRMVSHEEVIEAGRHAQSLIRDAVVCAIEACPLEA